ncbi:M4 family metallopeptidase [Pyxidicoccus xibeiensis]|uniref:M4 family metallopeptidase n=1 Tax=Pyxidicoccus xibeiensis TaxID=2906759 RepID=UPI0020A72E6F|nr:M4 family metallopeptidase [Pyxidicoccus xibeiensis]MCP3141816.1 peptidase M4 family protein [Pyxidicoccus xibeiensis]
MGTEDYGGVHSNSGIPSLAFQLLASGGRHPNSKTVTQVPAVGVEKAARIFYKASTDLSGAQGSTKYFCLDVPAGKSPVFRVYGGQGVLYMYARIGTAPTTESYHCKTAYSGHDDSTCSVAAQTTHQRIYVMLSGHESYFNVSLTPRY